MSLLILGISPSRKHEKSPSLARLKLWMDWLGIERYSFDNVCQGYGQIKVTKSDRDYVKQITKRYTKIITLGTIPDKTLKDLGVDHFALPHPSGLNRKLNDPRFVEKSLVECGRYLYGGSK